MSENIDKEKINFKLSWQGLKRHLSPFKKEILLLSFLGVISAIGNGAVPYVTGKFFDELIKISTGTQTSDQFPVWLILIIIWLIIQFITNNIDWIIDRKDRDISIKLHMSILVNGFSYLLRLPMSFHKNEKINKVIEDISGGAWRLGYLMRNVTNIAPQILSIVVGIILAASINTTLAGVLVIGVFLYAVTLLFILPKSGKRDAESSENFNASWDNAAAINQQIESVKQSNSESYEESKIAKGFYGKTYESWMIVEKIWSNVSFFQRTLVYLTQLTIFIMSINFVSNGIITVGELVALNGYAAMFFGPFVSLGFAWQYIQNGFTKAGSIERIFNLKTENYEPKDAIKKEIEGNIEFSDVYFKYEKDEPEVLKGINFKVNKGEVIALVGESGTGKSTTIQLISGYYFPTEGQVLVEGIPTDKIFLNDLRQSIAVVPQEVALFNDTIENNIKYGTFGASLEEVKKVAKEAQIDEFIESLPNKYETLVGDRGIKLSVGQKQRVAIARAILRDPKILILDEPTSALDSKTEKFITESLEGLMKDRTTFIIAHRLSTVRKADKILVFDKGKIVEEGKHSELIKKEGGVYQNLYNYQIGLH